MPLGGGQDLLARMKDYITQPDRIVNVKAALDATVTPRRRRPADRRGDEDGRPRRARAGREAVSRDRAAAIEVGTPQIRNQGTVGGNLNQRPRCWYYRNEEFVCFKKGGNQCFSPAGENQFHAIFGGGPTFIVHPSSLAVPSVAYGATFRLAGPKGERLVPAAEYFTHADAAERASARTCSQPDELLTHVILPAPGSVKSGHYEVRYKDIARLADRLRDGAAVDERRHRADGARRHGRRRADAVAIAGGGSRRWPESRSTRRPRPRQPMRRCATRGR